MSKDHYTSILILSGKISSNEPLKLLNDFFHLQRQLSVNRRLPS